MEVLLLGILFLAFGSAQKQCTGTIRAIYVNKTVSAFAFGCVNETTGEVFDLHPFDPSINTVEDGVSTGSNSSFYFVDDTNLTRIHQLDATTGNLTDIGIVSLPGWGKTYALLIEWRNDKNDLISMVGTEAFGNPLIKKKGKWIKTPGANAYPVALASISSTGATSSICTVNTTNFDYVKGGVSAYGNNSFFFIDGENEVEMVKRIDLATCQSYETPVTTWDLYSIRYDPNYSTGIIATGIDHTTGYAVILTYSTEGDVNSWKVIYNYPTTDFFYGLGTQTYANNKVYAPMSGSNQNVITTVDVNTANETIARLPREIFIADMQAGY